MELPGSGCLHGEVAQMLRYARFEGFVTLHDLPQFLHWRSRSAAGALPVAASAFSLSG